MIDTILVHVAIAAFAAAATLGFESVRRRRADLMLSARGVTGAAVLVTIAVLLRRGVELGAFPVVSLYETHLFIAALLSAVAVVMDMARRLPILTVGAAPLSFLSLLVGALVGHAEGPPSEMVKSAWSGLHVLAVLAAYSAFGLAFVSGVLYLIEQRQLKAHAAPDALGVLPSLETCRRLTVGAMAVGVGLLTAGIVVGYLYARRVSLPHGWRLDPKVWGATLTWAVYLVALGLSFVPAFRGRRTAMASVACFVVVMVTFWAAAFWSNFHRFL